ncbi:ABC transporter substrate-binding protein [Algoriphagus halophytocola]|uniref:ABC transporter substrate-binding protein n=1 Tax=Algoriphagus halophytocola TaxID=2991499 RepID=A0ABY6MK91_9BACT|nr:MULTISPECIES: ABC transporter substrate-binding protein [unclassified Algoriphagus]UZD22691.1 ABC transporter substrate-binding protein [Algoriphagus sp. TR-M5]WBL43956.1 ABC transporter substrate-binding protein [Algoriphagus sp. TR-M9]
MKKYLLLLPAFFILSISLAQSPTPEAYRQAMSQMSAKYYWEAIPLFRQFLDEDEYGNLSYYAALHLGEAALGANQPGQAVEALLPIASKNWAKSDESKYLLAVAYFKNQQNLEALKLIKLIRKDQIMKMAENATYENLKQVSSSFMVANMEEFKENAGFRAALKDVLESQNILSATERAAYYELQGNSTEASTNAVKDQILDVVVILPFTNSDRTNLAGISPSDFVFELYQGIEFQKEKLEQEGVKVNLISFDSKRDLEHLQNLLSDPAIAKADVIVGPIYQEESDLVSNFAETAGIPFVHPLSNLGDRFQQMKYSYLFRPSVNSLAEGIVDGLRSQSWGQKVAIGYSGSSRDTNLAQELQRKLSSAGFQVVSTEQINPRSANDFLQSLGVRVGSEAAAVDQVILLTDDPTIAQPVLGLMESITVSVPTLVMDSWLGFNFANYEMLAFPNFYFVANNTLKFHAEPMKEFRTSYYKKFLSLPSMNTILGAELVNWLSANMSVSKGFDLRRNLDQGAYEPGWLTWGFNFQNSTNNNYVPVFRLEAGELKPLQ